LERLNVIQNNQDKIMNQLTTLNGDEVFKDSK